MISLSVILPCYNEAESIDLVLPKLIAQKQKMLEQKLVSDLQIIVINDGSKDSSTIKIKKYASDITYFGFARNRGYGAALKKGIELSRGELISFYDLDDTHNPEHLPKLVSLARKNPSALVVGNRISANSKMPWHRRLGNNLFKSLSRFIYRHQLQDMCSGFRLFDQNLGNAFVQKLPDDLNFTLAMSVYCLRQNIEIIETDVTYGHRKGLSKLNSFSHGLQFLQTLIVYSFFPAFSRK